MTTQPRCTAHQEDFRGWAAYYLKNEWVRLVAVPDIGGRVMAYDLGGYPFFFVDPTLAGKLFSPQENQGDGSLAAWKNYGGDKTWPAPQGWDTDEQWHGPPDPVLDTGRYTVDEFTSSATQARIRMTSPPDPHTGVQITRQFTLTTGSTHITVDLSFRNTKDHPIRWSIWDVAQLRAERKLPDGSLTHEPTCVVTAPVNPASIFPGGFNVMFGDPANPQWQIRDGLLQAPYQWQIGKIGLDSPGGWIAFSNPAAGFAFVTTFTHHPDGDYPDGGATVEVWTIGAGEVGNLNYEGSGIYLMETEILSPLFTIPPGESVSFTLQWSACRALGAVIDVVPGGAVYSPLRLTPAQDDYFHLTGQFGVFHSGRLVLLGSSGTKEDLGMVDPLSAIQIDRIVARPAGALELRLLTPGGENLLLAKLET